MKNFFGFGKWFFVAVSILGFAYIIYVLSTCLPVRSARVSKVDISNIRLVGEQKLEIGTIHLNATGIVGETYVIHTNLPLLGERHDTVPLTEFTPGARSARFEATPMVTVIGFDAGLDSGRIFSPGSYAIWNRNRTAITLNISNRNAGLLRVYSNDAVDRSDSYFTGRLDSTLYHSALHEMVGIPSYHAFVESHDFYKYCYAKAIKVFAEQFYEMSEGKKVFVTVVIDGVNFDTMKPTSENIQIGALNVNKTYIRN